jgi:hypothetical protein
MYMGLKEQFSELAQNPVQPDKVAQRQQEANMIVKSFMSGGMTQEELRSSLNEIDSRYPTPHMRLEYAGPLYGFLRKIVNADPETAQRIAKEERSHYFSARDRNFNPYIRFEVEPTDLHIFVAYTYPDNLTDDDLRQAILDITFSPTEISYDDLAKIPAEFYTVDSHPEDTF